MRVLQILGFGMVAALFVAGGAWALAWFGAPPPLPPPPPQPSAVRVAPEAKPPGEIEAAQPTPSIPVRAASEPQPLQPPSVVGVASEPQSTTAAQSSQEPPRGTLHLSSEPQGADARASFGASCRTPCSMEVTAVAPFTVTFTRQGFASSTVPVAIEPAPPGERQAKFAPDPVSAQLAPATESQPEAKNRHWRTASDHGARHGAAHHAALKDGVISRSWNYVDRKRQAWQKDLGRVFRGDIFR